MFSLLSRTLGRKVITTTTTTTTIITINSNNTSLSQLYYKMVQLTPSLLRLQDDVCSAAILELLKDNISFKQLAASEGAAIIRRDREDDEKLAEGIKIAQEKGILSGNPHIDKVTQINVAGKSAQEITSEIIQQLPKREGNIIVMQGLSGTGKGTTVCKLQKELPRCVSWSNGNVFRSYTYLCSEALQGNISTEQLTPELLQSIEKQISFEKLNNGQYDIVLKGEMYVSDIQNTLLKTPQISNAVPTVAQQTQGEVIRFAAAAVEKLSKEGYNVILEGRAQTLNHIPTPLRFELVMNDISLLGERRAAQRVMAKALADMKSNLDSATTEELNKAVLKALSEM